MTHHYANCHSCANDTVWQRKQENNEEDERNPDLLKRGRQSDAQGSKPFFWSPPERSLARNFRVAQSGDLARDIRSAAPSLELRTSASTSSHLCTCSFPECFCRWFIRVACNRRCRSSEKSLFFCF